jgi:hypothetical protein
MSSSDFMTIDPFEFAVSTSIRKGSTELGHRQTVSPRKADGDSFNVETATTRWMHNLHAFFPTQEGVHSVESPMNHNARNDIDGAQLKLKLGDRNVYKLTVSFDFTSCGSETLIKCSGLTRRRGGKPGNKFVCLIRLALRSHGGPEGVKVKKKSVNFRRLHREYKPRNYESIDSDPIHIRGSLGGGGFIYHHSSGPTDNALSVERPSTKYQGWGYVLTGGESWFYFTIDHGTCGFLIESRCRFGCRER